MTTLRARPLRLCLVGLTAFVLAPLAPACGGQEPPKAPAGPATATATPAKTAAAPPADLSPVPEPKNLLVSGRVTNPSVVLRSVKDWAHIPMPGSEVVTEGLTNEAVGAIIDLEKSIDIAATMEPGTQSVNVAISAAVKDLEKAKAAFGSHFKMVPGDNGAIVIQGLGRTEGGPDGSEGSRACSIVPAFGAATHRLVCAETKKTLDELAPYLTRTLARADIKSDAHFDFIGAPAKKTVGDLRGVIGPLVFQVGSIHPVTSGLVRSLGLDIGDLVLDLDRGSVDAKLDQDGVLLTTGIQLDGDKSAIGKIATAHPEKNGPPPAAFWKLPVDSDVAYFHNGIEPKDFAGPKETLSRLLSSHLERERVPAAESRNIAGAAEKFLSSKATVYGAGFDAKAFDDTFVTSEMALGKDKDRTRALAARRAQAEALLGWKVLGVEAPIKEYADAAKALVDAWSKPAVNKGLREEYKTRPLPVVRKVAAPAAAKLPKDAFQIEIDTYPFADGAAAGAPRPLPITWRALFVPDGDWTWIVIAADAKLLLEKAAGLTATAPETARLKSRAGLEWLGTSSAGLGGFVTGRGLQTPAKQLRLVFGGDTHGMDRHLDSANVLQVPLPFAISAQPGRKLTFQVRASRAAIGDAVTSMIRMF